MRRTSTQFKEISGRRVRNRGYCTVSLGIVNGTMQSSGAVSSNVAPWSNKNVVFDNKGTVTEYATLEENFFRVDGSMMLLPNAVQPTENEGISLQPLGAITLTFDTQYDLKGLTINFGEYYPTEFTVLTDGGTHTYTNNESVFSTNDNFGMVSQIVITPISMIGGQQRLRIRSVLMGVGIAFTNKDIKTVNIEDSVSPISAELPFIKFSGTFFDMKGDFDVDSTSSFINYLEQGQELNVLMGYEDDLGSVMWLKMGTYFLQSWDSKKGEVSFNATDKLTQLEGTYTLGNRIYTRTAYAEAISILTDAGLEADEYEVDEYLSDITLTNPMPEASHKECLQLLANACRCLIRQDTDGKTVISANFASILEPDDIQTVGYNGAAWSNANNVITGNVYSVYADLTRNFFKVDGSYYMMPNGSAYLDSTGYVSTAVSRANGTFATAPMIELTLPAAYIYYGVQIDFDGTVPHRIGIRTLKNGVSQEYFEFTDLERNNMIVHEFPSFDTMQISFLETEPYSRVLVNRIALGDTAGYTLEKKNMTQNPHGFIEDKTRRIDTKIYTFENDEHGKPQEVEDSVFYTQTLNPIGSVKTVQNQLISSSAMAQTLTEWLAFYYLNNKSYSVEFRGEPTIEASDTIKMESDYLNNLQVVVEEQKLSFNGSFSGSLELRKATKVEE